MGNGFEHAALAVFTTLAPMGAASFIALAYAFIVGKPNSKEAKRLDKWTAIPITIVVIGFLGAFMHLANPLHAYGVFAGIGSSPLSNEILVGVVFFVAALIYWVLALTNKLGGSARSIFLIVLSVLAFVFAIFCGLAYMMQTIPPWNTPFSIVQMIGYALAGGTVLGFGVIGLAHVDMPKNSNVVSVVLVVVGILIGAVGFGAQIIGLATIYNIWGSALALVPAIWALFAAFVGCGIISAALTFVAAKKAYSPTLMTIACIIVVVGIFIARIGFYGLYMGIAL